MHLPDASQSRPWKQGRQTNQGRPEALVNEGDLASHRAANQYLLGVANRPRDFKDEVALGMGPPASADPLPGDGLGEGRNRALRRFQNDAVLADEGESLPWSHELTLPCGSLPNVYALRPLRFPRS
jgi:hypothetical protein